MKTKTKAEKIIKVGVLYNAFDPSQMEYSDLTYRKNTSLKTYLNDLPTDCEWKIGLNGVPVTLETHGKTKLKPTDTIQLVVVPRGGGAKNILRMVALVAVAVGAAMLFGPGGALAFSIFNSAAAGAALGMAVFTMAGGLLINALLPPKAPKIDSEDSSSYGYDGAKNTAREGVPLPTVYGKFRVAGNYVDLFTDNVGDDQYLSGRTIVSDGLIQNVSAPYLNDQPIENYSNVEWGWKAGKDDEEVNPLFSRSVRQINKGMELTYGNDWTVHSTTEEIDKFQVNLVFPQGIVHFTTKKGEKDWHEAVVQVQYKLRSSSTWIDLNGGNPDGRWPATAFRYYDKRVKAMRRTIESGTLTPGLYDIRVKKVNANVDPDHDYDQTIFNDVSEIVTGGTTLRTIANAYYRVKMTEQLNSVPNITWLVEGVKVNRYDINGNVTEKTWTDNPAWIVLDMLIGEERGSAGIFSIDFPAFIEWAEWCDTNDLKFNGVFDTTTTLWDACVDVLKVGHAAFSRIGTKLSLAIDKPQQPVMLFGPGNIFKDSFNINYLAMNDRANEFELSYYDRDDLNTQKTIRVIDPDAENRGDLPRAVSFSVPGIDNFEQAQKEIWYQLYNNRYLRRTISFDAPVESIGLGIGDVALVQHDIVNWGTSGRLDNGSTLNTIKLDRPVTMDAGEEYSLLVIHDAIVLASSVAGNVETFGTPNVIRINNLNNITFDINKVKRVKFDNGDDYGIKGISMNGYSAMITLDRDFTTATPAPAVSLFNTDVIEERDVVFNADEGLIVTTTSNFSIAPKTYSNFMFGVKNIVKKPYRLKAISGTGFDQRTLSMVEYNEAIYNPPETLVPFPATTEPKTVLHVRNLAWAHDQYATYENSTVNGVISWQAGHIKNYGGADIYISIDGGEFTFYQTVFNTNESQLTVSTSGTTVVKVISFNSTLTRASVNTAPSLSLAVESKASELDAPTSLNVEQISYLATALVEVTWNGPEDLSVDDQLRIRYRVQVKPEGNTEWDEWGVTDQYYLRVGELRVGTHAFRVRSEIGNTFSNWTNTNFTTFVTEETISPGATVGDGGDLIPPGVPTGLNATSAITDNGAKVTFNWTQVGDADLAGYVLAVKEPSGNYVEFLTSTNSHILDSLTRNVTYTYKVKAYDKAGNYSAFSAESTVLTSKDTVAPGVPAGLYAEVSLGSIFLRWNNPGDSDLSSTQIHESTDGVNFVYYASVNAEPYSNGAYTRSGLTAGSTRWFKIASVDTSGNVSALTAAYQASTPSISETDFTPTASGIAPVYVGSSLPTTGNYENRVASVNGKLYRYVNGAWTSATAFDDITGDIVADALVPGIVVKESFAPGVQPLRKITSLSESGSLNDVAVFTGDNKLYRHNGTTWVKNVDAVDINGLLKNAQIESIATEKLTGTVSTDQIANGSININKFANGLQPIRRISSLSDTGYQDEVAIYTVNGKLYRYRSGAWTATVEAVDVSGELSAANIANGTITNEKLVNNLSAVITVDTLPATAKKGQLAFLTSDSKIYRFTDIGWQKTTAANDIDGQITNGQIQSIQAAKLTDQIQKTQISDGAISTPKLEAGAVITSKIAAGAVTVSKLTVIPESIIADPYFADEEWWTAGQYDPNGWVFETPQTGSNPQILAVSKCITLTPNQSIRKHVWGKTTPFNGNGQVVRFRALGYNESPDRVYVGIRFRNWQGTEIGGADLQINPNTSTVQTLSTQITVPVNTAYYQTVIYNHGANNGGVNTGNFYPGISAVKLDVAATGELIVDGAITARKIAALTITANEIDANAITTVKLDALSVTGNKIAGNTITGDKIVANQITAGKLVIAARPVSAIGFNFRVDADGVLRWDSGTIAMIDDNQNYTGYSVTGGSFSNPSSNVYLVYVPGRTYIDTTYEFQFVQGNSVHIHVGTWRGGSNLDVKIGAGTILNGGQIVTNTINANKIVSYSITTDQLASNSVRTVNLDAQAVTAAKIATGTITADQIAANTLTAKNLVVSDYTNMVDFGFNEGIRDKWTFQNEVNFYNDSWGWTYASTGRDCGWSSWVPVIPNESYNVSARVANDDPNYNINLYVMYADSSTGTNPTSWLPATGASSSAKGQWVDINANVTAQRTYMRMLLQVDKPSPNSYNSYWKRPSIRRAANGTLIVDGSITTQKMIANSIEGDRIKANTLNADRIVTNSIASNKLTVMSRPVSTIALNIRVDADGWVRWDTGHILITGADGNVSNYFINAGSAAPRTDGQWTYFVYFPGSGNIDYTTLAAAAGYQDWVKIATWQGGTALTVNAGVGTLINGDRIVTNSIHANKIIAQTISANQIATNAITTIKLDAEAVTADKIKVGTITANQIASNTITTSRLLVVPASLCPDPYFNDIDFWSEQWDDKDTVGWYVETYNAGVAAAGSRSITLWSGRNGGPGQARKHVYSRTVACPTPGTKVRLKVSVENGSNQWADIVCQFFDANNNQTGTAVGVRGNASSTAVLTSQGEIPAGSTKMRWVIYNAGAEGPVLNGYIRVSGVTLDVAASADLIVDGAVTADKIAANSVNADKIVANSITANKLTLATRTVSAVGLNFNVGNDNILRWDSGIIHYPDSNGNYAQEGVAAGSASFTGNYLYFYYTPGRGYIDYGDSAAIVTYQNSFPIATWEGGKGLTVKAGFATILNGERIITNSIHANRIQANTITVNQMAADSITAAQIQAGAVGASEIAAGAITASKIGVRGENLFPDPQVQDLAWWKGPSQGTTSDGGYVNPGNDSNIASAGWELIPNALSLSYRTGGSRGMWQLWSDGGFTSTQEAQVVCPSIMAKSNTVYQFKVGCFNASNKNCSFIMQYFDQTGAYITGESLITFSAGDQSTRIYERQFKTPSNATSMRHYFQVDGNANFSGYVNCGNFSIREAASGTMVVDGSITTDKMIANTINGDRITAGTLNADKIVSNSNLPATLNIGNSGFNLGTVGANAGDNKNYGNYNGDFQMWDNKADWTALPSYWVNWGATSGGKYMVDGEKNKKAFRITTGPNEERGIQQTGDGSTGVTWALYNYHWVVIEAEILLNSGTFHNAGILLRGYSSSDTMLRFGVDPDVNGLVYGFTPSAGGTKYVFKKLVKMQSGGNARPEMYLMNHWSGFGSTSANGNDITWLRAGWRFATETEVNPAKQINAFTTLIEPGKILIQGSTTLNSWKNGNDSTEIRGGAIAANTITVNKLSVGARGVNFTDLNFTTSGNTVSWGGGAVYYQNDGNSLEGIPISAGSATFSGNTVWIWWNKGGTSLIASTNWNNNPDDVMVAVYHGGNDINANYGRTIINGDYIQTGTVNANRIITGSITATQIAGNSITADRLNVGSLSAISGVIGLLRTATSGARMELESNQLRVYDGNGTLRVQLGSW